MTTAPFRMLVVSACLILNACASTDKLQHLNGRHRQPINFDNQPAIAINSDSVVNERLAKQEREIRELQIVIAELSSNQKRIESRVAIPAPLAIVSNPQMVPAPRVIEPRKAIPAAAGIQPKATPSAPVVVNKAPLLPPVKTSVPVAVVAKRAPAAPAGSQPKENADLTALRLLKIDPGAVQSNFSGTNFSLVGVKSIKNTNSRILIELLNPAVVPVVVDIATKKPVVANLVGPYLVIDQLLRSFVLGIDGKSTLVRMTSMPRTATQTGAPAMQPVARTVLASQPAPQPAPIQTFTLSFGRGSNEIVIERNNNLALQAAVKNKKRIEISASGDSGFPEKMQQSQIRHRTEEIRHFLITRCSVEASRISVISPSNPSSERSSNQGLVVIRN